MSRVDDMSGSDYLCPNSLLRVGRIFKQGHLGGTNQVALITLSYRLPPAEPGATVSDPGEAKGSRCATERPGIAAMGNGKQEDRAGPGRSWATCQRPVADTLGRPEDILWRNYARVGDYRLPQSLPASFFTATCDFRHYRVGIA